MGTLTAVPITAGTGTDITTFQRTTSSDHDQVVREARATAMTRDEWPVVTTAAQSRIAADANRVAMTILSNANSRVYVCFDNTAPTSATDGHDYFLDPGDRWEVPKEICQLAFSFLGASAGGHIQTSLFTAS